MDDADIEVIEDANTSNPMPSANGGVVARKSISNIPKLLPSSLDMDCEDEELSESQKRQMHMTDEDPGPPKISPQQRAAPRQQKVYRIQVPVSSVQNRDEDDDDDIQVLAERPPRSVRQTAPGAVSSSLTTKARKTSSQIFLSPAYPSSPPALQPMIQKPQKTQGLELYSGRVGNFVAKSGPPQRIQLVPKAKTLTLAKSTSHNLSEHMYGLGMFNRPLRQAIGQNRQLMQSSSILQNHSSSPRVHLPQLAPAARNAAARASASIIGTKPLDLAQIMGASTVAATAPTQTLKTTQAQPPQRVIPQKRVGSLVNGPTTTLGLALPGQSVGVRLNNKGVVTVKTLGLGKGPMPTRGFMSPIVNKSLPQDVMAFYYRGYMRTRCGPDPDSEDFRGRFQCAWCEEILPTNVSASFHILAHVKLEPKQFELEDDEDDLLDDGAVALEDLLQCPCCLWDFRTPLQMEQHLQSVHSKQPGEHTAICYICEAAFHDGKMLRSHMHGTHHDGPDAPYWCKICYFRSSLYEDIKFHFIQRHGGTRHLWCPLCLHIVGAPVKKQRRSNSRRAIASTEAFVKHMMDHVFRQDPNLKCNRCRLVFPRQADLTRHISHNHSRIDPKHRASMQIPCQGWRPKFLEEVSGKRLPERRLIRPATKQLTLPDSNCVECRQPMDKKDHFKRYPTPCSICAFESNCFFSFVNHMMDHATSVGAPSVFRKRDIVLRLPGRCRCGFSSTFGNKLASHLEKCEESSEVAYFGQLPSEDKEDAPDGGKQLPKKLQKRLKLAWKSDTPVEEMESDSDKEDELIIQKRMRRILEQRDLDLKHRLRNARYPGGEEVLERRPMMLFSPKRHHTKSLSKDEDETPPEKRVRYDSESSRSESSTSDSRTPFNSHANSDSELAVVRRRKKQQQAAQAFLGRYATADETGETYKKYRDRAQEKLAQLTTQTNTNKWEAQLCMLDKSAARMVTAPGHLDRELLESLVEMADIDWVMDDLVGRTVEALKREQENGQEMEYEEFLAQLSADSEEEPAPTNELEEANLFARLAQLSGD